jgi:hypothetical protein
MVETVVSSIMPAKPEDLHEYISFEDPDEDRTWVFDVTYLLSNWMCIFGQGCQGILTGPAPELHQGCCSYGAHFIDEDDLDSVKPYVDRLTDDQWQYRKKGLGKRGWVTQEDDGTFVTRVVDGACIFLNRPGFEGGIGCSLHSAALAAGERPLDWKPDVCWQVPVRLQEHTDDHGHITSTVREWKRRDWGDGGFEFHWWCTDDPRAFVGKQRTYVYLEDEITELCGRNVYALLVKQLEKHLAKPTVLPHPARRKK